MKGIFSVNDDLNTKLQFLWLCFTIIFTFVASYYKVDGGHNLEVVIRIIIASLFVFTSGLLIFGLLFHAVFSNADSVSDTHLMLAFSACYFNFNSCRDIGAELPGVVSIIFSIPIGILIWSYKDSERYKKILDTTLLAISFVVMTTGLGIIATLIVVFGFNNMEKSIIFFPATTTAFSSLLIGGSFGGYLVFWNNDLCSKVWEQFSFPYGRAIVILLVGLLCAFLYPYGQLYSKEFDLILRLVSMFLGLTYALFLPVPIILYLLYKGKTDPSKIFDRKFELLIVSVTGGIAQFFVTICFLSIFLEKKINYLNHFFIEVSSSFTVGLGVVVMLFFIEDRWKVETQ